MVFGLFRDKELEEFSRGLAKELAARIPATAIGDGGQTNSKSSTAALIKGARHVFLKARNYCRDRKLGVLKKARLSKSFQDELASLGYQKEFIKQVTLTLAEQLIKL